MKNISRLGTATWCGDVVQLNFNDRNALMATTYDGRFTLFDMETGQPLTTWKNQNEQLSAIAHDKSDRVFVGGSFGVIYSLRQDKKGNYELKLEKEVLTYIDTLSSDDSHQLLAASCSDELRILNSGDLSTIASVTFPETIKSVQWYQYLSSFLVVCRDALYTVSADGVETTLLDWDSRILAASLCEKTGNFVLMTGVTDNGGRLVQIKRDGKSIEWSVPLRLDSTEFAKVDRREWDDGVGAITIVEQTGEILLSGVDWLEWFSQTGEPLGRRIVLPDSVRAIAVSPDGKSVAASTSFGGIKVWDPYFKETTPSGCHYSAVTQLSFVDDDHYVASVSENGADAALWYSSTGERKWMLSLESYWCDGVLELDSELGCVVVATSDARSTTLTSVSISNGKITNKRRLPCQFRARVRKKLSEKLWLTPSWAYGPSDIAAVAEPSDLTVETLTPSDVPALGFSILAADESWIIGADDYHIWIWDRTKAGPPVDVEFPDNYEGVTSAFFFNATTLILVSQNGAFCISLPQLETKLLAKFTNNVSSSSQTHRDFIAIGFYDGHVELRRLPRFQLVHSWVAHPDSGVTAVEFARNRLILATGAGNGCLAVWDASEHM